MEGFSKKTELRLIINENDTYKGNSVCRLVVEQAHKMGIAGATIIQTKGGYGSRQLIHTSEVLRLSSELPVVISIVDDLNKLQPLIAFINEHHTKGLLSLQDIWVRENNK